MSTENVILILAIAVWFAWHAGRNVGHDDAQKERLAEFRAKQVADLLAAPQPDPEPDPEPDALDESDEWDGTIDPTDKLLVEAVLARPRRSAADVVRSRFAGGPGDSVRGGGPLAPTPEQCDVWGTKEHHGIPDYPAPCIMPAGHEGNHKTLVFTYPDGTKG